MDTEQEEDELIEQSEMRPPNVGLYCFIDSCRACGPDCLAYVAFPNIKTIQTSELSEQQVHCAVVTGIERAGRGIIMLASSVSGLLKKQEIQAADASRRASIPDTVTSPFGKGR